MRQYVCLVLLFSLQCGIADNHHPRGAGQQQRNKITKRSINGRGIEDEDKDFWLQKGSDELNVALGKKEITTVAKNVILFIGDGMSLPTVTAARILKGQKKAANLEDGFGEQISWDSFPNVGLSKTYCASQMVSDSAATASAMYTGVKTTFYTMGYDRGIVSGDPTSTDKATELETILDWAQQAGKRTGFVTTTRMSHATPAALYAKSVYRFWECDKEIQDAIDDPNNKLTQQMVEDYDVKDITRQLIESEAGKNLDIMLGGGRSSFLPPPSESRWDYEDDGTDTWDCYRNDGRNLIEEWLNVTDERRTYIENRTQLVDLDHDSVDKVMGIFTNSYVTWDEDANEENNKPHIKDMALEAVKFLQAKSGDDGYFIMIEGGRIDTAHHNGNAARALSEVLALDRAVEAVMGVVDTDDTLVMVTADHSHTFTMGGYPTRAQNVLGVVGAGDWDVTIDKKPFTIVSYGNGPGFTGYTAEGEGNWTVIDRHVNLTNGEVAGMDYHQASAIPLSSETHGGDDVGVWAIGPWSHLIHGVHEQSYLAQVMSYSSCLGPHKGRPGCEGMNSGSEGNEVKLVLLVRNLFAVISFMYMLC